MKLLAINLPNLDLSYFSKRGLEFEVEHKTINEVFPLKYLYNQMHNGKLLSMYTPFPNDYLESNYKQYNYAIILVGYNPKDYSDAIQNTGGYSFPYLMSCGSVWSTIRKGGNENAYALHELNHDLCAIINLKFGDRTPKDFMDSTFVNGQWLSYYKNENPEAPDGNFAQTWNSIVKFLPQLKAIRYATRYKYFSQKEVDTFKLKPELFELLDKAREIAGVPFVITSGLRTPEENNRVGGVYNSSHLKGLGADIACVDNEKRSKILRGLLTCGKPVFIEVAKKHIHVDISISNHLLDTLIVEPTDD